MILKAPQFGNTWQIDTGVKTDRSSGGSLLQYKDTDWKYLEAFHVTFENMSLTERDALENFLVNTAGTEIDIQDFEGRNWKGLFLTDPIVFTLTGRGCKWSTALDFEGTIQ